MLDFFYGLFLGLACGLVPGLHVNSIVTFIEPSFFLIIPLSIAFVFSSFFSSVLLGVPNSENAVGALPGHRLVMQGKVKEALSICFCASMLSGALSIFSLFVLIQPLSVFYDSIKQAFPVILSLVLLSFALKGKHAIVVIMLSSALGMVTFNSDTLTPLLTGFFAASGIILSSNVKSLCHKESTKGIALFDFFRISALSSVICSLFSIVPAVSSSIASASGNAFGKMSDREFLALSSATSVNYMIFSFYYGSAAGIYRSGPSAALSAVKGVDLMQIAGLVLVSCFVAGALCISISCFVVRFFRKLDQKKLNVLSLALIVIINFIIGGFFGLLVLFASTSIGIYAQSVGVSRVSCISALILPTIVALL